MAAQNPMKTKTLLLALLAAPLVHAAAFTAGDLVVSRVGDGTSALVNSGGNISLMEFSTSGSLAQTINVGTIQLSGTATSEGALALSKDRSTVTIAGYISPFTGTGSLASRTDVQAPRGYVSISAAGTVAAPVAVGAFSANNIRSAVTDSNAAWLAGGNSGTLYNTGSNVTIQSTVANTRVVNIINGNLYFSTGSGTQGVYGFSGAPTASATATLLLAQANAYDFTFNAAGTVAYVASNSGAANGAITRFTFSGGVWTAGASLSAGVNGVTGLAVDFGVAGDTIYAVTPSNLLSVGYTSGFGAVNTLATAGTNYAFRGLEFAPSVSAVPEPSSTAALAGGAILGFAALRRRRRA